ncbi:hypothetical protein [Thermosulfurimonas marina]|uniref:hypothetical protein n=1 Tax=Thermosulfurimonas marina TaxID=2047767 RepID=UPI001B305DD7|nr:hypothetical protein [Thermosulfurimonas marina]
MRRLWVLFFLLWYGFAVSALAGGEGFTREDRERLLRLEATLRVFMEQVDKRFEQVNQQFEQLFTFLWIITGIFTALVVAVIGFAYWDRRTIIRRAREEAVEEVERM